MNQSILSPFGNSAEERVLNAINAFKNGNGVLVLDDEDRENEGDLIFPAETVTSEQMAKLIRYGSGIVCLCITDERCQQLDLPPMVEHNNSVNKTAFTVTIEAAQGVSTGVTEASVDLARLAGFKPAGVICEITNDDGTMARAPEIVEFAKKFGYVVLTIEDLVEYRLAHNL